MLHYCTCRVSDDNDDTEDDTEIDGIDPDIDDQNLILISHYIHHRWGSLTIHYLIHFCRVSLKIRKIPDLWKKISILLHRKEITLQGTQHTLVHIHLV